MTSDLYDISKYEAILQGDFRPGQYGNEILKDTNSEQFELDLNTSIKILSFQIKEVKAKFSSICSSNYEILINNFEQFEKLNENNKDFRSHFKDLNNVKDKINNEFMDNYESNLKLFNRLNNINTLYLFLNELWGFLNELRNFNTVFNSYNFDKFDMEKLLKTTESFYKLNKIINDFEFNDMADISYLLTDLKIIEKYQTVYKLQKLDLVNKHCLQLLKETEYDDSKLKTALITLLVFNSNDTLVSFFRKYYNNEVSNSINFLKRIIVSPRTFSIIFKNITGISLKFLKLRQLLSSLEMLNYHKFPDFAELGLENIKSLEYFLMKNLNFETSIFTQFYKDLLNNFKRIIKEALIKGGPVSKNLRSSYQNMKKAIIEEICNCSSDLYPITNKNDEVLWMIESIRELLLPI